MSCEGTDSKGVGIPSPWTGADWAAAVALGLVALGSFAALVLHDGGEYARLALSFPRDRYFQSDCPDVVVDMTNPAGQHARGLFHPLFCGLTLPIAGLLMRLGAEPLQAVWAIDGAAMAAAVVLLYVAQRALGVPRVGSTLVGLLAPASAGFLFWGPLPETFPLGFLAMSACLTVAAVATRARIPAAAHLAAGVLGLGMTITNWMAPLATLAVFEPRRRAIALAAATAAATFALWGVEKRALPHPPLMILRPANAAWAVRFFFHPDAGGPLHILRGELIAPIAAPEPVVANPAFSDPPQAMASFQESPAFGGPLGTAATVAWLATLGLGLAGLASGPVDPRFRAVLAMILAGQVVLHLLYGEETFLYALHFLPVLLLVVAMGVARWSRPAEALLALTIVLALANNLGRLRQTIDLPLPPTSAGAAAPGEPGR